MRSGFSKPELLAAALGVLLLAVAASQQAETNDEAREAEVKRGLHSVQIAVERHAVDTDGAHPRYLIGGDLRTAKVLQNDQNQSFLGQVGPMDDKSAVSDPLLYEGYLLEYPDNPFVEDGMKLHQLQVDHDDPLRVGGPGTEGGPVSDGSPYGTRFGARGTQMGQVLADFRFPQFRTPEHDPEQVGLMTHAEHGYGIFDVPLSRRDEELFLPGQFFYKSAGPLPVPPDQIEELGAAAPLVPVTTDQYVMGAYGAPQKPGYDALGPEQPIMRTTEVEAGHEEVLKSSEEAELWHWTRSERSDEKRGSPFRPVGGEVPLAPGNPNGITDGLEVVLSSAGDGEGELRFTEPVERESK